MAYLDSVLKDAEGHAAKNFANHRLVSNGPGRWHFYDPENPHFFWFSVLTTRHYLCMVGDTGDLILHRSGDVLDWLRHQFHPKTGAYSPGYMAEKVSNDCKIHEFQEDLVKEFVAEQRREFDREEPHSQIEQELFNEKMECFDDVETPQDFYLACREIDYDDPPSVEGLTWHFFHSIAGLRAFCRALDAVEALDKYPFEAAVTAWYMSDYDE